MKTPAEPAPVTVGNTFITLLAEMQQAVQEIAARRSFDADVGAWLAEMGFVADFEEWRKKKNESRNTPPSSDAG